MNKLAQAIPVGTVIIKHSDGTWQVSNGFINIHNVSLEQAFSIFLLRNAEWLKCNGITCSTPV